MAALAVRKTTWNGLSNRNRTILRWLGDVLALGKPAEFSASGTLWFVFDDWRFKAKEIAYFGCVLANLSEIPSGYKVPIVSLVPEEVITIDDGDGGSHLEWPDGTPYTGPLSKVDRPQLRSDIRNFCESPSRGNLLVLPEDIAFTEGGNVWQEILDAQNAPSAIQMADSVPDTWTAVNDE